MRITEIDSCNIAVVDPSTTCTGFCILATNLEDGIARIRQAGFIKWPKDTPRAKKLADLHSLVADYFYIQSSVDLFVHENFYFNMARGSGGLAVAECIGAMKAACYSDMVNMEIDSINKKGETTWKKGLLGKGKVEKSEVKKYLQKRFPGKIPDRVLNPTSGREINIPDDLTDALAMAVFYVEKMGFKKIEFDAVITVKEPKEKKATKKKQQSKSILNFLKLLRKYANIKVHSMDLINYYDGNLTEPEMILKIVGEEDDETTENNVRVEQSADA